ncbi:uncharacterized protein LOC103317483 [Nasonia vitripennis]|uniref:Uncharacterized protein n=1 Tax=Nasonia vitripennis TaxID=7425 RepID=A0A7M7LV19_NASVI|nr:uncharacterized protein LOC103317483 [Nasonia vitripennis]XP_031786240.1 uncharacterized protein LOC103317483 [Nasonia vitripennis]
MLSKLAFSAFSILVLLGSWISSTAALDSVVRSLSKNWTLPAKSRDEINIKAGNLLPIVVKDENGVLYMTCQQFNAESTVLCKVTLERWPFEDGAYETTCDGVEISAVQDLRDLSDISLYSLAPDKVLIVHTRYEDMSNNFEENFNLTILDMADCTTASLDGYGNSFNSMPVLHRDHFAMIFKAGKYCTAEQACKVSLDFEGKRINDSQPFDAGRNNLLLLPVSYDSPELGYYSFNFTDEPNTFRFSYVSWSGQEKLLLTDSNDVIPTKIGHSNAHELHGVCWIHHDGSSWARCAQFDTEKLRMNVTVKLPGMAQWLAVHNLDDGSGILLATGDTVRRRGKSADAPHFCEGFRLQRIRSDGTKYESLCISGSELQSINFHSYFEAQIIEKGSAFCVIWVVRDENRDTLSLLYERKCIPKKYL